MSDQVVFEFHVQYKMLGGTGVHRSTFASANKEEVMATLATQGVTPATVDHLYVHQILADNKVAEVVAIEPDREKVRAGEPVEDNVIPISRGKNKKERRAERRRLAQEQKLAAAKSKPHVKIKRLGTSTAPPIYSWFYKASPL